MAIFLITGPTAQVYQRTHQFNFSPNISLNRFALPRQASPATLAANEVVA